MDATSALEAGIRWDGPSIIALRRDMLRFARAHLRDAAAAEDTVQEALLSVVSHAGDFAGRAAAKTWVFAILRNKIVDHLRRASREIAGSDLSADEAGDDEFDRLFDQGGHWQREAAPATWADPDAALASKEFWGVLDACLTHLPERVARVYVMRELLELDTAEICAELGITTNNCWVILHRARTALRECLENGWFSAGGPGAPGTTTPRHRSKSA